MSQRLLDRQTLNSLINELTEISDLAISEDAMTGADVERLRQQTEQLAALSESVEEPAFAPEPVSAGEPTRLLAPESVDDPAAENAEEAPTESLAAAQYEADWLQFDASSEILALEWPYTQDAAVMSQRVHRSIETWLEHSETNAALSQLQLDFVQLANSGEAPQQWRCTLKKSKGRQRHLQIQCEYKKQRQMTAEAVLHTH